MSAHAYIQWADVPQALISSSQQHVDGITQAKVVAFDGCPFAGEIEVLEAKPFGSAIQIEFAFPRNHGLRNSLIDWFMHHSIPFTVVM
ncbi:phage portal protein [Paraburkholderia sp. CNPSo 3157]|uniref:Phage portal protein n=1 Tax=Paraburkholderia franconis TaxID=2654983 RepID=A0A7X1N7S0_9BURK|nr:phage portal protein [Paraburkholderia franconis]MPW16925.1 phage portal protein [Paraburkholderia franconis]